jgi:threonine synthase
MRPTTFQEILIAGLAPDGGLVIPESYPRFELSDLAAWRAFSYRDLAFALLRGYVTDLSPEALRTIVDRTYTSATFGSDDITPVLELDNGLFLLRLSFGPTLAFKDIAMQLLGNLFEHVLSQRNESLNILGATSGDTGSSAEEALRGKSRMRVFMLSPEKGMSPFQQAQMFSLNEPNVFNIAVRGVFDDCQDMVKAVAEDAEFKALHRIGAVNSINWARVAAQIVYYFKAYLAVVDTIGDEVSFSVPSGNFGNVLAGHIARQMGLPIRQLIVATNENDVLDEFFRTGSYRPRPAERVWRTSSPSMDISKASNFERFVYDLVGRDPERLNELWAELANTGSFDLTQSGHMARIGAFGFCSGSSSHAARIETIRQVRDASGLTIDPHTADGVKVGRELWDSSVPLICLETALATKFEATLGEALGSVPERPSSFVDLESRPQRFEVMNVDGQALKKYIEERTAGH